MSDDSSSSGTFRESILRDVFDKIDFDEAVNLVGVLFEHRIVFSKSFWSLLKNQTVRIPLDPLEAQDACILVGRLFDFDCDTLFLSFQREWSRARRSPEVKQMLAKIQTHLYVERLEEWTPI